MVRGNLARGVVYDVKVRGVVHRLRRIAEK
jgi:hypothetical protein